MFLEKVSKEVMNTVDESAKELSDLVDEIISPYTSQLDDYIHKLHEVIRGKDSDLSTTELSKSALYISCSMYSLVHSIEKSILKQNIAEIVKLEKYNSIYQSLVEGTISDKKSIAENKIEEEKVVELLYKRCYNKLKMLYDSADKVQSAIHKVINLRIAEMNLSLRERG